MIPDPNFVAEMQTYYSRAALIDGLISWVSGLMLGFVIGLAVSMTEWWKNFGDDGL